MNIFTRIKLLLQINTLWSKFQEAIAMSNDRKTTVAAFIAGLGLILAKTTGLDIDADIFDLLKQLPWFQNGLPLSTLLTVAGVTVWGWFTRGTKKTDA